MSTDLRVLSANIQGGSSSNRLDFGIMKAVKNLQKIQETPDVILCQETWQKDRFKVIDNDNYNYYPNEKFNINKNSHIGMGMQIAINQEIPHKIVNFSDRLQLVTILQFIHIINLYAPQVNLSNYKKNNFKNDLTKLINSEIEDDLPILMIGDYNIEKSELSNSYLNYLTKNGEVLGCNKSTQKYGKELDYGTIFKKQNLHVYDPCSVEVPTSDHDGIFIHLKNDHYSNPDTSGEKSIPRLKVPMPKNLLEIDRFKKRVRKKWNDYMLENPDINSFFNSSLKFTCSCLYSNHRKLLNQIYEFLRETIIQSAIESTNKKSKKRNTRKGRHSKKSEKIYQSYKTGHITRRQFKRNLKKIQIAENIKVSDKLVSKIRNSKEFYTIVKSRFNSNQPKTLLNSIPFKKIAETYSKIYEPEDFTVKDLQNLKHKYQFSKKMAYRPYSSEEVKTALNEINKNKASRGPVIELWIMASINDLITQLLNKFNQHGYYPEEFLTAEIVMLKKCNTKPCSDHNNYRPISLIESLSEVSEILIRNRISWTISKAQYAYQRKVSTLTCLKDYSTKNRRAIGKEGISFTAFLDMSKAFDKLSLKSLLLVLEKLLKNDPQTLRSIAVMLTSTTSTINSTYRIKPRSGIRQGVTTITTTIYSGMQ